ncbi:hypothetical protein DFH08DRAFT_1029526 [Mycena albidolilacea]|uniref:Uncharacterized protein n=1 Tax=Mycena albidolilacea TaxID=1033008 RepID=A0AAD6ZI30_9AGAR|nr:hypothetical protein DFH08DRAFT_1029526 [Mycena albidolilacea]
MILSTILTSPTARVYNLRILLLANIPPLVLLGLEISYKGILFARLRASVVLGFSCPIVICVHHILAIFKWPMRGLALIDLGTIVIEIGILVSLVAASVVDAQAQRVIAGGMILLLSLPLGPLLTSLLFRITTVIKTKERLLTQRLRFLGCCARSNPPYTPLAIILNRSLARPLVRGESRYIVVSRALVLSCVALGVPAFGIYVTVIMPLTSVVSTRTIRNPQWTPVDLLNDPRIYNSVSADQVVGQVNVHNRTLLNPSLIGCPESGGFFRCPCGLFEIDKIFISIVVPSGADQAYVDFGCDLGLCDGLSTPLPLLPGSRLFGLLRWSQRQQIAQSNPPFMYAPEIYALQTDPSSEPMAPRGALLTLLSPHYGPFKFLQDTADASPLSGIATFGGFWTFVNGTFALFFGANVVYFMFGNWNPLRSAIESDDYTGRRPLSALGVVHLFQRRALVRQWHEDFPAIHTEGSLPGSENAGIVAFIRERLVDMGEDPRGLAEGSKDAEDQLPEESSVSSKMAPSEESADEGVQKEDHCQSPDNSPTMSVESYPQRPGYILDEIPLLELDLGMDAVTTWNRNTLVKHDPSQLW